MDVVPQRYWIRAIQLESNKLNLNEWTLKSGQRTKKNTLCRVRILRHTKRNTWNTVLGLTPAFAALPRYTTGNGLLTLLMIADVLLS
ncbi:MAG TPA: hypothetical protein DC024_05275 [Clostridiales bacterium]|nr:hypothetical protein [Clostridiales bacterium]